MKKYTILLIVTFIVLALLFMFIPGEKFTTEDILIKAFQNSGSEILKTNLNVWGKINGSFTDLELINSELTRISNEMKLTDCIKKTNQSDSLIQGEISGKDQNGLSTSIKINSIKNNGLRNDDTYLVIDITEDRAYYNIENARKKAEDIFEGYKIKPETNLCLIGTYTGKMEIERMNKVGKGVLQAIRAVKVEGVYDRNLSSITAYSPMIEDVIKVKEKKVNMNMALRYNSYENKTYLWLATPVITIEY